MKDTFPTPQELRGTVQGTILYLSMYLLVFLQFQSYSKLYLIQKLKRENKDKKISLKAVKYYNSKDLLALNGDRTVGNFLEQSIAFLPLLWMHALFVDPGLSWNLCLVYCAFRVIYPVVFIMKPPTVLVSTVPGYLTLVYMFVQLLREVVWA